MASIERVDVRDLQCVITLAETFNFTETAKRLHMTQPGVTARINKVEKNHGYKLFVRSKGIVRSITPEGFVFAEEAREVLEHLHRLISRSDATHRASLEVISVSRAHHADLQLLSVVIAAQAIDGTHISIHSPCNSDKEAIAMLLSGRADAALVSWPVNDAQVSAIHLTHDSLMVVLPESHVLRNRTEIHIEDLRNEQIIGSKYQFPATLKNTFACKVQSTWLFTGMHVHFSLPR